MLLRGASDLGGHRDPGRPHPGPARPARCHDHRLRPRGPLPGRHRRFPEPGGLLRRLDGSRHRHGRHVLPTRVRCHHPLVGHRPHPRPHDRHLGRWPREHGVASWRPLCDCCSWPPCFSASSTPTPPGPTAPPHTSPAARPGCRNWSRPEIRPTTAIVLPTTMATSIHTRQEPAPRASRSSSSSQRLSRSR